MDCKLQSEEFYHRHERDPHSSHSFERHQARVRQQTCVLEHAVGT